MTISQTAWMCVLVLGLGVSCASAPAPPPDVPPTPRDAEVADDAEIGACLALCESCSLWPCGTHCARDCAEAATAVGTCAAIRECIMDPAP